MRMECSKYRLGITEIEMNYFATLISNNSDD